MSKQQQFVMRALKRKEPVSNAWAAQFGITRLGDVIYRLRCKGVCIKTRIRKVKSRQWGVCRFAEYSL